MDDLVTKNQAIGVVEFHHLFYSEWVLSNDCTLLQEIANIFKVVFCSKAFDIQEKLILRNATQRVLDPVNFSARFFEDSKRLPTNRGHHSQEVALAPRDEVTNLPATAFSASANSLSGDILCHGNDALAPVLIIQHNGAPPRLLD